MQGDTSGQALAFVYFHLTSSDVYSILLGQQEICQNSENRSQQKLGSDLMCNPVIRLYTIVVFGLYLIVQSGPQYRSLMEKHGFESNGQDIEVVTETQRADMLGHKLGAN